MHNGHVESLRSLAFFGTMRSSGSITFYKKLLKYPYVAKGVYYLPARGRVKMTFSMAALLVIMMMVMMSWVAVRTTVDIYDVADGDIEGHIKY